MIISEQWLREWVNPPLSASELADQLTMAGLEVDALDAAAEAFSGVIVAEILEAEQHPDADKLRVCKVSTGASTVQIVCGAPNARSGLKAPLAQVGAVLPGDFKIKKAKLRGVESQGMLCAESELTISDEAAGLMELPADAPVGEDLRSYLGLDDHIIEIGLTPNRADCLSIAGIARDLAALNELTACEVAIEPVSPTSTRQFPVQVVANDKCPRYVGRVIENVDLSQETPREIVERLRRAGLRSIDPVVDGTNYVMLELGQPLHAFDLDTLAEEIVVRNAQAGEVMVLLDGSEVSLTEDTLLIADRTRPLAMAGIMGGENSGVSASTRHIFLESAFFSPTPMAGKARQYGLHTDASHRYERGVDPELQHKAIERATALLLSIVGGQAGPITDVTSNAHLPQAATITLRASRIQRVLGFSMDPARVEAILTNLGFGMTTQGDGEWLCHAPSWRFDMEQEVDLIEELARIHGYNALPVSRIHGDVAGSEQPENKRALSHVRRLLVGRGFQEAITYSFISPELQTRFDPQVSPVALKNPISADLSVMRTSLLPGLLSATAHNAKRQLSRVRLFETGLCFLPGDPIKQEARLGLVMMGPRAPENWANEGTKTDFFDMKGEVEQLLHVAADTAVFRPCTWPGLHDGQTAEIVIGGQIVGILGAIHPVTAEAMDLPPATYVAELQLSAVTASCLPAYVEISRFPETRRDIAVVLNAETPAAAVEDVVRQAAGPALADLRIFDVYAGQGIEPGHKSLALGLTFRDQSRTLDDFEITSVMTQVIDSLQEKLNAKLRG